MIPFLSDQYVIFSCCRKTIACFHFAGGDAVILYASKYHDIPAVVNLSSPSDLVRGMEDRFGKDIWNRLTKDGYVDIISKTGNCLVLMR